MLKYLLLPNNDENLKHPLFVIDEKINQAIYLTPSLVKGEDSSAALPVGALQDSKALLSATISTKAIAGLIIKWRSSKCGWS